MRQKTGVMTLSVEQSIWTSEVGKITLGRADAKPSENKRDYQLFLGDSFFRDEPHFVEAKAAYIAANATPRVAHEKSYDMPDGDLWPAHRPIATLVLVCMTKPMPGTKRRSPL